MIQNYLNLIKMKLREAGIHEFSYVLTITLIYGWFTLIDCVLWKTFGLFLSKHSVIDNIFTHRFSCEVMSGLSPPIWSTHIQTPLKTTRVLFWDEDVKSFFFRRPLVPGSSKTFVLAGSQIAGWRAGHAPPLWLSHVPVFLSYTTLFHSTLIVSLPTPTELLKQTAGISVFTIHQAAVFAFRQTWFR